MIFRYQLNSSASGYDSSEAYFLHFSHNLGQSPTSRDVGPRPSDHMTLETAMIRSTFTFLFLASTLTGCGTVQSSDDTATGSGYTWGPAGSTTDTTDTDDTETDDTDTDSGLPGTDDTDSGVVVGPIDAQVYIYENTADVNVCLYGIANATTGDYSEYSSDFCSTSDGSKGNGWLMQPVTYTPGQVLVANGKWSDGTTNQRYLAEAGALLTNVSYILVVFEDDTYDQYSIGTTTAVGDAYIKDASGYHDWMIVTTDHTTGDYDLPESMK